MTAAKTDAEDAPAPSSSLENSPVPSSTTVPKKRGRRPKGAKAFEFTLQVRLSSEQHQTYQGLGGYAWLRSVLDVAAQTPDDIRAARDEEPLFIRALPSIQSPMTIPAVAVNALSLPGSEAGKKPKLSTKSYALEQSDCVQWEAANVLTPNPSRTFFYQLTDDRLADVGFTTGDIVVVKQDLRPKVGDLALMVDLTNATPAFLTGRLGSHTPDELEASVSGMAESAEAVEKPKRGRPKKKASEKASKTTAKKPVWVLTAENAAAAYPTLLFPDFKAAFFGVIVSGVKHFRQF